jgi:mTERF domain-containing protein
MLRTLLNPNLTSASPKLFVLQIRSISWSRRVKSERGVSFLKGIGFSEAHITRITRSCPVVLFADSQKTLIPKLEFFRSLGISKTDLYKIISSNPILLESSLKNQFIPCYHYLKSVLHTDENVVKTIKTRSGIFRCSVDKILAPNISLLSEIGVPESRIQNMLMHYPRAFQLQHTRFKSKVEEVISLGFNPMRHTFLDALNILCTTKKTTLDRKWAAYRKENLSDDEIRTTFRAFPNCLTISEEKITRTMDFLVNKMGFEVVNITTWPVCLGYNLEKRTIPRCRVIKVLCSHGVLKKGIALSTFLGHSETKFLNKFVCKYEDKVPGLLKIYEGKETGTGSDNLDVTK